MQSVLHDHIIVDAVLENVLYLSLQEFFYQVSFVILTIRNLDLNVLRTILCFIRMRSVELTMKHNGPLKVNQKRRF